MQSWPSNVVAERNWRHAERTQGPMRGPRMSLCHWHAGGCVLVAWQNYTSFFFPFKKSFFCVFIYIWLNKTWNNTNSEINLNNRAANDRATIYIHEAPSGKMLTKWTRPSTRFSRKASQLIGKKCIICLRINTKCMWIFRIVYLEKKEEKYDSLEILTIRMFPCMGIYWSWNTWYLNMLIVQMCDILWKN